MKQKNYGKKIARGVILILYNMMLTHVLGAIILIKREV